jgi:hypothetical protein
MLERGRGGGLQRGQKCEQNLNNQNQRRKRKRKRRTWKICNSMTTTDQVLNNRRITLSKGSTALFEHYKFS